MFRTRITDSETRAFQATRLQSLNNRMRRRRPAWGILMNKLATSAAVFLVAQCATLQAAEPPCDRACLVEIADQYLAAIATHDLKKAPLSDEIVFVENLERTRPGQGFWADAA